MGNVVSAQMTVLSPEQTTEFINQEGVYSLDDSSHNNSFLEQDEVHATVYLNPSGRSEADKRPTFFHYVAEWEELDTVDASHNSVFRPIMRQQWLACSDSSCLEEKVEIAAEENNADTGIDINYLLEQAGLGIIEDISGEEDNLVRAVYAGYIDDKDGMDVMVVLSTGASLLYSHSD